MSIGAKIFSGFEIPSNEIRQNNEGISGREGKNNNNNTVLKQREKCYFSIYTSENREIAEMADQFVCCSGAPTTSTKYKHDYPNVR